MIKQYFIGVVSENHVQTGTAGGFAQLCHGKAAPLMRMKKGDWIIYYSPKTEMHGGSPVQAFTAIGKIADDSVYPYKMNENFIPYRRNVCYLKVENALIKPLLDKLSFIKDIKHWGYPFRCGHFEINKDDFLLIKKAMCTNEK